MKIRMKIKIKTLVITVVSFILLSCSEGLLGDMLRVIADPVVGIPTVTSFEKEETIEITWNADPGADGYILYRAVDTENPVYEILYQGTDLSVSDTDVINGAGNRYLYILGKVRGTKLFGPSDPALGVGSMVIQDELENNDTKGRATRLIWDLDANLYYYLSYSGAEVKDYDWYSVIVPPRKQANIVITQEGLSANENCYISFALESGGVDPIINSIRIPIKNKTYVEKTFYFKISPIPGYFYDDPPTVGGSLINYHIYINSITSL